MASVENPVKIEWGGRTVGGTENILIDGPYAMDLSYPGLSVSFDLIAVGDAVAQMADIEKDFRERDRTFKVTRGGSTIIDINPASGTGFDTSCAITRAPDNARNRESSVAYVVTFSCSLPASPGGSSQDGLRNYSFSVNYDESRRRMVTITGVYTGLPSQVASHQVYLDNIAQLSNDVLGIIGETTDKWEVIGENFDPDRVNGESRFSIVWREIIYNQTGSVLDDPAIVNHSVVFTNIATYEGDSVALDSKLEVVEVEYRASVDKDQTTDLAGLLEGTILPYVRDQVIAEFSADRVSRVVTRPAFDKAANTIRLYVSFLISRTGSGWSSVRIEQAIDENRVIDYTFIHDGGPVSAYADPGWTIVQRSTVRDGIYLGPAVPRSRIVPEAGGGARPTPAGGGDGTLEQDHAGVASSGWNAIRSRSSTTPIVYGKDEDKISATRVVDVLIEQYTEEPEQGAATPERTAAITPSEEGIEPSPNAGTEDPRLGVAGRIIGSARGA